jgi:ribosome-associated protein
VPLVIDDDLTLPDGELPWTASRSSGPGGQNVNKVSTRVTVTFDVAGSPSLPEMVRIRLLARLTTRLTRDGLLRVSAQRARSQPANLRAALERLADLIRDALREDPPRTATRPTRASRERRLSEKTRRSSIKRDRKVLDD